MDEVQEMNQSKVSFSKMTNSMLQRTLLIQEEPAINMNKKNHSFLDEGDLNKQKLPRQVFDMIVESIPNMAVMLGVFYYNFINMYFVRQIGDSELVASFGMGVTWYNSTSLSILISLGQGLSIQLAQAYGAKNFKLMSELFQRSQAIEFTVGIISSILLYNTKSILTSLGISENIAYITEQFSISCIPSVFGSVLYDTTRQLLIAQNIFDIPMKVQLAVYFIHPLWGYVFTQIFTFGVSGVGIARAVSEYSGYFILCYIIKKKNLCKEFWDLPYNFKLMFQKWIPYLKISIPVGSIMLLEWIYFEIQTILVGLLHDDKILAGQASFTSLIMFFYMSPLGLSITQNSYLGNAVGEGKKKLCKNLSSICMFACLVEIILFLLIGEMLKDFFTDIFVTDSEMEKYFRLAYNMYIYTYIAGDYYQVILSGILKCCDFQIYASYVYFTVFYIFGIPMTYFLTFTLDLKLIGVWLSQSLASTVASAIMYIKITKIDWDESIKLVQNRVLQENMQKEQELRNRSNNNELITPSCSPVKQSTI